MRSPLLLPGGQREGSEFSIPEAGKVRDNPIRVRNSHLGVALRHPLAVAVVGAHPLRQQSLVLDLHALNAMGARTDPANQIDVSPALAEQFGRIQALARQRRTLRDP